MRAPAFSTLLLFVGLAPANAQSFEEAVRANLSAGAQLCLSGGSDVPAWVNSFRAAGFAERVERSALNSDTTHYFTAPAGTAEVELYYGEMPEHCFAKSRHLGVTAASQVLDTLIPRLYPGYSRVVAQGATDPATGRSATCVRYEDPTNPIGHVVGVTSDAGDGCIEDGTSVIYSSYRV
jgi:hypothetical protein